jgi:hypothetical protein
MLIDEARWIGRHLAERPPAEVYPLCNVGSSTADFRSREQPWIDEFVFGQAKGGGHSVIHVDQKNAEGVDLAGDLLDPAFRASLRELSPRTILCSNLLEHVTDRGPITEALTNMLVPGGRLIVTVPYHYPVHHDPIDTRFRPTVEQLAAEFPRLRLVTGEIVVDSTGWRYMRIRRSVPGIRHWGWLLIGRRYKVSCVILEATS